MKIHKEEPYEQAMRYYWKARILSGMPVIETTCFPAIHVASVWLIEVAEYIVAQHNKALSEKHDLQKEIEDLSGEFSDATGTDPDEWTDFDEDKSPGV
jgi:hypothetical protein